MNSHDGGRGSDGDWELGRQKWSVRKKKRLNKQMRGPTRNRDGGLERISDLKIRETGETGPDYEREEG